MSAPSLSERVLAYLGAHSTLNLATHGPAGLWCAAVLYVAEGSRLYFTSVATTRHGQNLLETRCAAGTINDDAWTFQTMKGIQLEGRVEPVTDLDERQRVVAAYLARFPFSAGLWHGVDDAAAIARDPGTHGFFRLTPTRMYFMDNEHHPQGREHVGLPLSGATSSVGQRLLDDHIRLANLCQRVVAAFEGGDRAECDATFRELERDLEGHLRFEERELLPRYERDHPTEVAEIHAEHDLIRSRLTELGVGVDLHLARCTAVRKLMVDLGDHARREGKTLYRWVDTAVDEPTRALWLARRYPI